MKTLVVPPSGGFLGAPPEGSTSTVHLVARASRTRCIRWRNDCTPAGVPAISRAVERSDTPGSESKRELHPGGVQASIAVEISSQTRSAIQ